MSVSSKAAVCWCQARLLYVGVKQGCCMLVSRTVVCRHQAGLLYVGCQARLLYVGVKQGCCMSVSSKTAVCRCQAGQLYVGVKQGRALFVRILDPSCHRLDYAYSTGRSPTKYSTNIQVFDSNDLKR